MGCLPGVANTVAGQLVLVHGVGGLVLPLTIVTPPAYKRLYKIIERRLYYMAKAKKLPSGAWRALVYDYTDQDGKRHYESFTASTKKKRNEMQQSFLLTKNRKVKTLRCLSKMP